MAEGFSNSTSDSSASWTSEEWTLRITAIVVLIIVAAIFAGITLGLMSLDKTGLEIVIKAGVEENATEIEKKNAKYASKIAPVRKNGNLLLTTLLMGNVAVSSLLSILMADMTSGTY